METRLEEIHPGEILWEEFMKPLGLSSAQLAGALDLPAAQVDHLIAKCAPITPDIALRLAQHFKVSQQFWVNLQMHYDERLKNGGR